MAPALRDGFSDGENPSREPGTHIDFEPALQRVPFLADRKHVNAFADFAHGHDAEEDALFSRTPEKGRHASIRCFAGKFGWDVGVNQIFLHSSISRPESLSRSK